MTRVARLHDVAVVRFGTGRDAADVAFATIFGGVKSQAPLIRSWAVEDRALGFVPPYHRREELSTDGSAPGPAAA